MRKNYILVALLYFFIFVSYSQAAEPIEGFNIFKIYKNINDCIKGQNLSKTETKYNHGSQSFFGDYKNLPLDLIDQETKKNIDFITMNFNNYEFSYNGFKKFDFENFLKIGEFDLSNISCVTCNEEILSISINFKENPEYPLYDTIKKIFVEKYGPQNSETQIQFGKDTYTSCYWKYNDIILEICALPPNEKNTLLACTIHIKDTKKILKIYCEYYKKYIEAEEKRTGEKKKTTEELEKDKLNSAVKDL